MTSLSVISNPFPSTSSLPAPPPGRYTALDAHQPQPPARSNPPMSIRLFTCLALALVLLAPARTEDKGKVTLAAGRMGTSNGLEVSPDCKMVYVREIVQRNAWAFHVGKDGALSNKRLLKKFDDHGFGGMRCDVDGNLYIARYGKGTVAVLSPQGKVLREVDVLGKSPSNLCFGGPDGRTVYVTEVDKRRLVQFRVDRPGLAWKRWQEK